MVTFGTNYCKKKKIGRGAPHNKLDPDLRRELDTHCDTHFDIVTNSEKKNSFKNNLNNISSWILFPTYHAAIVILTRIQNDTEQNSSVSAPNLFCKSWHLAL